MCPAPVRPNETLMALLMKMKTRDMPSKQKKETSSAIRRLCRRKKKQEAASKDEQEASGRAELMYMNQLSRIFMNAAHTTSSSVNHKVHKTTPSEQLV
ncbi:hypothetical protein H920_16584 [Fukomys damarensis]|uniref:Uncharacterized protein n=1 Tax=Fukomys damarensis TaxID=885580 RepID=A0A091DGW3_FUKDA|nr:hypothetical protein H920_16584 [Fukomys damarensis]